MTERSIASFPLLTVDEESTLRRPGTEGDERLEQERIPWQCAVAQLGIG